ncbi:MAG TPA: C69 family dipeptidase [Acidobacteriota bacterium]|nr:C69 family dipeptidase [Acidobacteriota bacterium]
MIRAIATIACIAISTPAFASYCVYVGKNLTANGSVFLGGYGDEPSSHWLEIVLARTFAPGTMTRVGVTDRANYPGMMSEIPQVERTAKYITMNYSEYAGFPAPLTNGGLNEHGVAARDVWSTSRSELRDMTPSPQTGGPNYSDLARIAMERAHTARQAVEIVGELIDRHGFSTYGGNSHLFADADEGWVFINFAGGQGLWAAERLGPDDIRVSRPGYIHEFPVDFDSDPDYMASDNFISFAIERGWYDPEAGEPFNVTEVYGQDERPGEPTPELIPKNHLGVHYIEDQLRNLGHKVTLEDMIHIVRMGAVTHDSAGYGQVAELRDVAHPELALLWVAATTPETAPFIPFRIGVTDVPAELKYHRYLSSGQARDAYVDEEVRGLESTRFALRTYKRLRYLMEEHEEKFLPEVTEALVAFEGRLIAEQTAVERTALKLFEAGVPELARRYLTYYSGNEALDGMRLGDALADSIEARTKAIYGIRQ